MIGKSFQVNLLSGLLRQAELQHKVTSQNIANVNTPGYQALDVTFEKTLAQLENRQSPLEPVGARIAEAEGLPVRQDGNNVDIDRELGNLTKNALHFDTYAQLLATKVGMMRSAITGR